MAFSPKGMQRGWLNIGTCPTLNPPSDRQADSRTGRQTKWRAQRNGNKMQLTTPALRQCNKARCCRRQIKEILQQWNPILWEESLLLTCNNLSVVSNWALEWHPGVRVKNHCRCFRSLTGNWKKSVTHRNVLQVVRTINNTGFSVCFHSGVQYISLSIRDLFIRA